MQKELEIEFKNLLTEAEFTQLCTHFQATTFLSQTNTYFDTPDFQIKARGGALRIREKTNTCECTLKLPNPDGHGLFEFTQQLPLTTLTEPNTALLLANEVLNHLTTIGIATAELRCLTALTTKRCEFAYAGGLLVLDESFYQGGHDFEIEFEHTDFTVGQQHFQALLTEFEIPNRPTPSKIKRAFATQQ